MTRPPACDGVAPRHLQVDVSSLCDAAIRGDVVGIRTCLLGADVAASARRPCAIAAPLFPPPAPAAALHAVLFGEGGGVEVDGAGHLGYGDDIGDAAKGGLCEERTGLSTDDDGRRRNERNDRGGPSSAPLRGLLRNARSARERPDAALRALLLVPASVETPW